MSVEAVEYREDPDVVLWALDRERGVLIEIGYGYKDRKNGTFYDLNRDAYSRQLLQEVESLRETKFKRQKHPGNRSPDAKPQPSHRPAPSMSRR